MPYVCDMSVPAPVHPKFRWALGILIFELCSGRPPFLDEDRLAMFRKICQPNNHLVIPPYFSNVRLALTSTAGSLCQASQCKKFTA